MRRQSKAPRPRERVLGGREIADLLALVAEETDARTAPVAERDRLQAEVDRLVTLVARGRSSATVDREIGEREDRIVALTRRLAQQPPRHHDSGTSRRSEPRWSSARSSGGRTSDVSRRSPGCSSDDWSGRSCCSSRRRTTSRRTATVWTRPRRGTSRGKRPED